VSQASPRAKLGYIRVAEIVIALIAGGLGDSVFDGTLRQGLAAQLLGRAYAISGDTAKSKAAYQDFLTLWKNADPDIPILKEAKAEYAKLQ
jgi:hypothetical protein